MESPSPSRQHSNRQTSSRRFSPASIASASALLITTLFAGMFSGVLISTRIMQTSQMGWDQLADFVGGAFFGVIIGVGLGILILWRATIRNRWIATVVALLLAGLGLLLLQHLPPNTGQPPANTGEAATD